MFTYYSSTAASVSQSDSHRPAPSRNVFFFFSGRDAATTRKSWNMDVSEFWWCPKRPTTWDGWELCMAAGDEPCSMMMMVMMMSREAGVRGDWRSRCWFFWLHLDRTHNYLLPRYSDTVVLYLRRSSTLSTFPRSGVHRGRRERERARESIHRPLSSLRQLCLWYYEIGTGQQPTRTWRTTNNPSQACNVGTRPTAIPASRVLVVQARGEHRHPFPLIAALLDPSRISMSPMTQFCASWNHPSRGIACNVIATSPAFAHLDIIQCHPPGDLHLLCMPREHQPYSALHCTFDRVAEGAGRAVCRSSPRRERETCDMVQTSLLADGVVWLWVHGMKMYTMRLSSCLSAVQWPTFPHIDGHSTRLLLQTRQNANMSLSFSVLDQVKPCDRWCTRLCAPHHYL